ARPAPLRQLATMAADAVQGAVAIRERCRMTEAEWLACANPTPMLEFLRGKASDRKLRLFASACCRRLWHIVTQERSRKAIEMLERYVDGQTGQIELSRAVRGAERDAASSCGRGFVYDAVAAVIAAGDPNTTSVDAAILAAHNATNAAGGLSLHRRTAEQSSQAQFLRCIIGNPFRPVAIAPPWLAWNDGTVRKIAQAIYDDRAFDRMPVLADALEDAGCDAADLLAHCRGPNVHVRGCWTVDLILGKH